MYAEGTVVGGRYRLIRKVGEGGMATIWEAEHQTLGSPVAVKFLQWSGPQAEEMRERFLREARVAASVRHRNVVEITDFGLTDDKTPYIVMEMLVGKSLADIMDEQERLEPAEAARLVSLTLRGLAAVHEKGIVHRDLKPENIFIVDDPDGSYPKLLDFGVSKRSDRAGRRDLTQEGILVGTPDYMSPEQARGLRDIDERTDIWSTGVILYEAISGRLPFESENVGDLIVLITTQQPTPITQYVPDLSAQLVDILDRALAKDREERFPDARSMRWAIIEAFRGEAFGDIASGVTSVSEMPPPPGSGTGSFSRPLPRPSGTGSFSRPLPRPTTGRHAQPTPSAPFDRPGDHMAPTPAEGYEHAGAPQLPLGAPPRQAGTPGLPPPAPEESSRRGVVLIAVGLLAAAVVALGVFIYQQQAADAAEEAEVPAPSPWEPVTEHPSAALLSPDGGPFEDAGVRVRLRLYNVPEGVVAYVEDVPIEGDRTELPMAPFDYRIEARGEQGAVWEVEHPGAVDGEYEVWPRADAGVEEAQEPRPTKQRRPRRNRRRR